MALNNFLSSLKEPFKQQPVLSVPMTESGVRRVPDFIVKMLIQFEGMAKRGPDGLIYPYHDMVGFPTIGVGHLLSRVKFEDLSKYPPITEEEAYALKYKDLDRFASGVCSLVTCPINDNEFGALVMLSFNIGLGNLKNSSLIRKLNRGDSRDEVGAEFLKWDIAQGQKIKGLTIRRTVEMKVFLSPC
jgi:GH24 family phage-related lysozyme (muramidase)